MYQREAGDVTGTAFAGLAVNELTTAPKVPGVLTTGRRASTYWTTARGK